MTMEKVIKIKVPVLGLDIVKRKSSLNSNPTQDGLDKVFFLNLLQSLETLGDSCKYLVCL